LGRPGFGLPHFKIFFIVSRHENGMPVKELAAMLGVTPSAVSQLVDPLVTRGILERKKDDTDRRSIRIRAAAKRNAEYERFATAFLDSARRMFSPLSDRELKTLTSLFTKINHATRRVRA
jgi:DNA-binding MarR family transcriptional regulator